MPIVSVIHDDTHRLLRALLDPSRHIELYKGMNTGYDDKALYQPDSSPKHLLPWIHSRVQLAEIQAILPPAIRLQNGRNLPEHV